MAVEGLEELDDEFLIESCFASRLLSMDNCRSPKAVSSPSG
jgi:hypothetical protein